MSGMNRYELFNDNLMTGINGNSGETNADRASDQRQNMSHDAESVSRLPANSSAHWDGNMRNLDAPENMGAGTLLVQVTLANGAIPMAGASVQVFRAGSDGEPIATLITDRSGRTKRITLPTPAAEYSQSHSNVRPYANYDIKVELPGYYTQHLVSVPIFDQVDSIQPVDLMPLAEGVTGGDSPDIVETEPEL